jgi:hypothetical protein
MWSAGFVFSWVEAWMILMVSIEWWPSVGVLGHETETCDFSYDRFKFKFIQFSTALPKVQSRKTRYEITKLFANYEFQQS